MINKGQERLSDRLRHDSRATLVRKRSARPLKAFGEPRPGDVYILPETAELGVEWAILARDAGPPIRFLAVPADTNPACGSADVHSAEDPDLGPLSLRCGFGVWLEARQLAQRRLSGHLPAATLEAGGRRQAAFEHGHIEGSFLEREVESDPEYIDWLRDIPEQALATLTERASLSPLAESSSTTTPSVLDATYRTSPAPSWPSLLGLAAGLLLLVSLGLGVGLYRTERLATARQAEQEERIALLERRLAEEASGEQRMNLPTFYLSPAGAVRGPAEPRQVEPQARWYLLQLMPEALEPFPSYRLEIFDAAGQEVFEADGLKTQELGEINLQVPAAKLPPGDYGCILYGLGSGEERPAGKYRLHLEHR